MRLRILNSNVQSETVPEKKSNYGQKNLLISRKIKILFLTFPSFFLECYPSSSLISIWITWITTLHIKNPVSLQLSTHKKDFFFFSFSLQSPKSIKIIILCNSLKLDFRIFAFIFSVNWRSPQSLLASIRLVFIMEC